MRKLIYLLLTLLVLTACTDRWEYAPMRHGLDSLNERNRNDKPLPLLTCNPTSTTSTGTANQTTAC